MNKQPTLWWPIWLQAKPESEGEENSDPAPPILAFVEHLVRCFLLCVSEICWKWLGWSLTGSCGDALDKSVVWVPETNRQDRRGVRGGVPPTSREMLDGFVSCLVNCSRLWGHPLHSGSLQCLRQCLGGMVAQLGGPGNHVRFLTATPDAAACSIPAHR